MQTTLQSAVSFTGTGLHSGRPVRMSVTPAPADHGLWVRRTDVRDADPMIQALYSNVTDTRLNTRLSNTQGVTVSTVEHVMAALAGCGIHNAVIEVDGQEVPIMDGSSVPFVRAFLKAGTKPLDAPMQAWRVARAVELCTQEYSARLEPAARCEIDFAIDFPAQAIGVQALKMDMANGAFVRELSDCRTFVLRQDVERLQSVGLALGGSLDNAVVVEGDQVLNQDGFRRADECVRHKILDAVGDLALAGAPIIGRYSGYRAGHGATNALLRKAFATPGALERVTLGSEDLHLLPGTHIGQADLSRVG
ncbi:MAG: UDP-3-O-acyl-N-acetylglucosamine deacetylase [Pseudomonadota bacterium]